MEQGGLQRALYFATHPRSARIGFRARRQPAIARRHPVLEHDPLPVRPGARRQVHRTAERTRRSRRPNRSPIRTFRMP